MDCIVCGTEAETHRLVVDTDAAHIDGAFCRPCERGIFGECFTQFAADDPSCCVVCGMDGRYVFVEWGSEYATLDALRRDIGRGLDDTDAPVLCRTHFCVLASDSAHWGPTTAGRTDHD